MPKTIYINEDKDIRTEKINTLHKLYNKLFCDCKDKIKNIDELKAYMEGFIDAQ